MSEFTGEAAEVLGEYAHRRCVEQVLEASAQAEIEDVLDAQRVHLAYGEIGRGEIEACGKVIDRVDAPAKSVECILGEAEPEPADVARHRPNARGEGVVPDPGFPQSVPDACMPLLGITGPDQTVHDQIALLHQEIAQEESTDASRGPGQQNLPKFGRGSRLGRRASADGE